MGLLRRILKLWQDQRGLAAYTIALASLVLGGLVVAPVLAHSGATALGRGRLARATDLYARDGGIEHGIWRLLYEPGFASSLTPANPSVQYVEPSGQSVGVTVTTMDPLPQGPQLKIYKTAAPVWVNQGVATTVTYTITFVNQGDLAALLDRIEDELPGDDDEDRFSYVLGSTGGLTTADPTVDENDLVWDLAQPVSIPPDGTRTLTFSARAPASAEGGTYTNEAEARIDSSTIGTGDTAPVRIISNGFLTMVVTVSPDLVTSGTTTTYTYTVTVVNSDLVSRELNWLRFWLEAGFTYVPGSTGQGCAGVAVADPTISSTGRFPFDRRYAWNFSAPKPLVPAQGTAVHCFQAQAALGGGVYRHEAEAEIVGIAEDNINSGVTAPLTVLSTYRIEAQAGGRTATAVVSLLPGSVRVYSWDVR